MPSTSRERGFFVTRERLAQILDEHLSEFAVCEPMDGRAVPGDESPGNP